MATVPREPCRRLGGGLIRRASLACEEADDDGRAPAVIDRAVAAVPRLRRMHLGQR